MLSSYLTKTTSLQKRFPSACITLYLTVSRSLSPSCAECVCDSILDFMTVTSSVHQCLFFVNCHIYRAIRTADESIKKISVEQFLSNDSCLQLQKTIWDSSDPSRQSCQFRDYKMVTFQIYY